MRNDDILVSIGVPCYNSAHFLGQALASAFAQSHRKIEVILYNDGGTDHSVEVACSIQDPRLTVISANRNSGVGIARQVIKTVARGDYLAWLDADDLFHPHRIEVLLEEALANNADLVIDNARLIDEAGNLLPGQKRVPDMVADDPFFTRIFERNAMLPHPLVSRRCYSRINFDPELTTSEDYDYWLRCSRAGYRFRRVDRAMLDYRITPGSLSSDPARSRAATAYIFSKFEVDEVVDLYHSRGLPQPVINYMTCLQQLFRGRYPEALVCAQKDWPEDAGLDRAFYVGTLALQCNQLKLASRHLQRHLDTITDSPAGLNNLGILWRRQGKDGTPFWQKALRMFPHYSDAATNLAGGEAITLTQLPAGRNR